MGDEESRVGVCDGVEGVPPMVQRRRRLHWIRWKMHMLRWAVEGEEDGTRLTRSIKRMPFC